jgi:Raf kinase inhibitor-like YbhB/YbcL family protein
MTNIGSIARRPWFSLALAVLFSIAAFAYFALAQTGQQPGGGPPDLKTILAGPAPILSIDRVQAKSSAPLEVTSTAFKANGTIPLRYTSYDESVSPALTWSAGPAGTKSYALMLEDATFGTDRKGNLHWMVFNLPAGTTSLAEGASMPAGAVAACCVPHDSKDGKAHYVGPHAPSAAAFRYGYQVFALDTVLNLDAKASRESLWAAMEGHVLAKGALMGSFQGPAESK